MFGPDHYNGKLQKYVKQLGIQNNVIFTGWRSDIGAILYASDICVASSIHEGFGLNLVESMACGLPVVAFDNRGHREIVKDGFNGYLIPQGNIKMFAERVIYVIQNNYKNFSQNVLLLVLKIYLYFLQF